ncbi:sel1 repeat family protein [Helicobacter sp. MIT 03-1614]|uniref:tetratricopeptide repeat protein n=1 Tax=Helicobacter sp. MIT 03-1614 TaxID=1548147 RepID=UPI00068D6933|nr:SEL1-like repeat protein [Helicobacter sp. MIT 03-1614]TLD88045.1 sel1 repeat family protein [Helicobacter sp. MIT 03-1614]
MNLKRFIKSFAISFFVATIVSFIITFVYLQLKKDNLSLEALCEVRADVCNQLGYKYDLKSDYKKARMYYQKGCDLGSENEGYKESCYNLGLLLDNGLGGDKDEAMALLLWEDSCKKGLGLACHNIAASYKQGIYYNKDIQKAREYYQKACELGHSKACFVLANPYFGEDD